jgi:hypothetical protein
MIISFQLHEMPSQRKQLWALLGRRRRECRRTARQANQGGGPAQHGTPGGARVKDRRRNRTRRLRAELQGRPRLGFHQAPVLSSRVSVLITTNCD